MHNLTKPLNKKWEQYIRNDRAARGQRRGLPMGQKAPTPTEESKMQQDNTKNATKNFDYTKIAGRLRTEMEMQMGLPTTSIYGNRAHLSGQPTTSKNEKVGNSVGSGVGCTWEFCHANETATFHILK